MRLDRPVGERYRFVRLLGEGGAGRVSLVEDLGRDSARVALKELIDPTPESEQALRREFAALASLRHPSLVEAFDFESGDAGGRGARFSLEFVEGDDLVATVRREGPASLVPLAVEALHALALLHEFGVIHRDVKPGNLLVRREPRRGARVVLLDFGLAAHGGAEKRVSAGMAGTLPYLAPELMEGGDATRRSDLYALGAVLHEAVHGRTPFTLKGNDTSAFLEAVRQGRRARPATPAGYLPELGRWIESLLSLEPAERPADAAEALARLSVAAATPLALETPSARASRLESGAPPGRGAEESALWAHIAPGDAPRVVWLVGGAGSGKSRMLRRLAAEGVGRGFDVVAPPAGADLLGDLADLRERASRRTVLVLLDEVESSGAEKIAFLERIAREPKGAPLRVVAALRPGEIRIPALRRLLGDTGTVPTLRRVDLEPLGAAGLHAMAERATGHGPSDSRLKWLVATTEGNALLAAAALAEGTWEKGGREGRAVALERSIEERIAALSPDTRRWLEATAVVGPGHDEALLKVVSGLDSETVAGARDEIAATGLARPVQGRWACESRIIAQIAVRNLAPEERRILHRLAAESLEARGTGFDADTMARLWGEAGESERSAAWATRAGDLAVEQNRPAEAAERYRLALRHTSRTSPLRLELRVKQAEALMSTSAHDAAKRAFGAARRLARSPAERLGYAIRQGHAIARSGAFERAPAIGAALAQACRREGLAHLEAEALQIQGIGLSRASRHTEAVEIFRTAAEMLRGAEPSIEGRALAALGTAIVNASLPGAENVLLRAIDLLRGASDRDGFVKAALSLSRVAKVSGRFREARPLLEEARLQSEASGNLALAMQAVLRLATLAHAEERYDRALELAREALDQSRHMGDDSLILTSKGYVAAVCNDVGRFSETVTLLERDMEGASGRSESVIVANIRHRRAVALMHGPPEQRDVARVEMRAVIDASRGRVDHRQFALMLADEIERRSIGAPPEPFDDVVDEFREICASVGVAIDDDVRFGGFRSSAMAYIAEGRFDEAIVAATAAVEIARRQDWPGKSAVGAHLLAEALRGIGRIDEAAKQSEGAAALLVEAAARISDPAVRSDFLDQPVFREIRKRRETAGGERRLAALYDMIRALNSQTDPEVLLESILDMALQAVTAERGMILLTASDGASFDLRLTRNLEPETAADAEQFSRGIVTKAGAGESVLALDAGHDDRFRDLKSVSLFRIRSLMCVPLRSRGTIIGTVYLDSRREGRLFSQADLKFVEAFADHAALALENARARSELERENRRLRIVAGERASYGSIVGRSAAMQKVFDLLDTIARSELPLLVEGESGTGKELVAKAVHFNGPRKARQFLSENCAALPESLLESELFGHVRGAFTGADRDRAGLFEQADGGTLFLDEVGDMSAGMQARLLRVLQEHEIRRVGGDRVRKVDVRVVAATNKDLPAAVAAGRFREDLYYRLNVLSVRLPPLRERTGDVALIAGHLVERISGERGRPVPRFESAVLDLLERYAWPGNVRQLENTIQRLVLLAGDGAIAMAVVDADDALRPMLRGVSATEPVLSLDRSEREQIRRALEQAAGNRDRAARLLGISRATIYRKLKEYGLN